MITAASSSLSSLLLRRVNNGQRFYSSVIGRSISSIGHNNSYLSPSATQSRFFSATSTSISTSASDINDNVNVNVNVNSSNCNTFTVDGCMTAEDDDECEDESILPPSHLSNLISPSSNSLSSSSTSTTTTNIFDINKNQNQNSSIDGCMTTEDDDECEDMFPPSYFVPPQPPSQAASPSSPISSEQIP